MTELLNLTGKRRTPFVAQSEGSECALACIAMVASAHGYETNLTSLRQKYGLSLKGATLKQVIQIAEDIGFSTRPLRVELDEMSHLSLPAVIHWDLNHFVVLTRVSNGLRDQRFHIHDPARGELQLSADELSHHFTGVALEIVKSERFVPRIERQQLGITQMWSSMSGFWQTFRQAILLSIVLQLISLASPFFLQISIDTVFPGFDQNLLLILMIGFMGLAIISFLTSWLRSLILVTFSNSLSYQMVVNLFRHLVKLPLEWFEKRHVGDIISRFGSTQPISQLLSQGMMAAVIDGVLAVLTLVLMFMYSGILGAIAVSALGLNIVTRLLFLQSLKMRNIDVIVAAAKENSTFIETVRGISAIKAFGQEGNRQRLWQRAKADAVNAQIKLGRLSAGFDAVGQFILSVEKVLFVYIAIRLAFDAKLTIGMIFAFQAYKSQFLGAGMRLVEQAINFKLIQVHLSRISDIAFSRPESGVSTQTHRELNFNEGLELRGVRYRYGVGEPEVLKGIDLQVLPGEMLALIGPSGCGKTTLMKIMKGLFSQTSGEIRVGGSVLSSHDKTTYRRSVGSVAQDDVLYAGSLAENISFFDPEIDMSRVEEVAKLACIFDEIIMMPMRFDTMVGDMGSVLSGGQKQRLLIARALYSRPCVLFIDEGTAHIDSDNESKLLENLKSLGLTIVVVAHRSRSIEAADRVVAVKDGQILVPSLAAEPN